jgi:DNA-directed RNA polymerase specialized sigma subunit
VSRPVWRLGPKRQQREAEHLGLSNAEVKNAWSYASISHMPSLDSQGQKNNKENLRTKKEGNKEKWKDRGQERWK